jgi:hypothetical protein
MDNEHSAFAALAMIGGAIALWGAVLLGSLAFVGSAAVEPSVRATFEASSK